MGGDGRRAEGEARRARTGSGLAAELEISTGETAIPAAALRAAWNQDRPTFGAWTAIGSPHTAEIVGRAGFDWVGIDLQHGLVSPAHLPSMLQALSITSAPTLVRVASNTPDQIMQALDAGADGVIVPLVNSAAEAAAAVAACRYPPAGTRSWGPARPSLTWKGYSAEAANAAVVCAVMVETMAAVDAIDEIVAVTGVDAVMVGPMDLGLSCGEDGSRAGRGGRIDELIVAVRDHALTAGVIPGIFAGGGGSGRRWAERGFRLVALASDVALLRRGLQDMAAAVAEREAATDGGTY